MCYCDYRAIRPPASRLSHPHACQHSNYRQDTRDGRVVVALAITMTMGSILTSVPIGTEEDSSPPPPPRRYDDNQQPFLPSPFGSRHVIIKVCLRCEGDESVCVSESVCLDVGEHIYIYMYVCVCVCVYVCVCVCVLGALGAVPVMASPWAVPCQPRWPDLLVTTTTADICHPLPGRYHHPCSRISFRDKWTKKNFNFFSAFETNAH